MIALSMQVTPECIHQNGNLYWPIGGKVRHWTWTHYVINN